MNVFIETLNNWGGTFLKLAWPIFWQSSLIIALVAVLDFSFRRKLRASVRYALWLVVLVKLCLPPTFASPTSPAWWLFPAKPAVQTPVFKHYVVTYGETASPTDFIPETLPLPGPPPPKLSATGWALFGSMTISLGLLLWLVLNWCGVARKIWRAELADQLNGELERAAELAGIRSRVRLKLVEGQMSPAVCGLFRPVILLPRRLAETLSSAQLRAVLLHELIHLRRRDVWVNCPQALLQIVYWWHPLLWLANARIRRLREEAVDDAVMLALRDEAETYAPTLLEVAKLAFHRPLLSLGLVGIMESRSALRQRIERLVDFRAPRKAGLTFVSACCVCAFSAVALPMGDAPAPKQANDSYTAAIQQAAPEQQSLSIKVDSEVFFRNLKAQAPKALQSPTNDWGDILMGLLRDEGVDCNPPHGLAFTNTTGEMTTMNTPEKLEVFRRVIEQLNRPDGICELPLANNPLRKRVLIEGRIYSMSDGEFVQFTAGLRHYSGKLYGGEWWSVPPERFMPLVDDIERSGLKLIQRPRIQTGSGMPATLYVGNTNNSFELTCQPIAADGFVDLALKSTAISGSPANAVTNQVSSKASAEDHGGIVLRMENYGAYSDINLVIVISAEIVTNSTRFHERLQAVIHRQARTHAPTVGQISGVSTDNPNFRMVMHALAQRNRAEPLAEPEVTTTSGHSVNWISPPSISVSLSNGYAAGHPRRTFSGMYVHRESVFTMTFRLAHPIRPEEMKAKLMESGVQTPPTVFFYNDNGILFVRGSEEQLVRVNHMVLKLNGYSESEIKAVSMGFLSNGKTPPQSGENSGQLFARTFKVDGGIFIPALIQALRQVLPGHDWPMDSNSHINEAIRTLFADMGLNLETPPGKAIFYNEKLGKLFIKATAEDLDTAERVVEALVQPSQQSGHTPEPARSVAKQAVVGVASVSTTQSVQYTGTGRQQIVRKLNSIRLEHVSFKAQQMVDVLRYLSHEAKSHDPEKQGVNFLINPNFDRSGQPNHPVEPNSGQTNLDIGSRSLITIDPPLTNAPLSAVLDAVLLGASEPIRYSIQNFGIVFSTGIKPPPPLYGWVFIVDTNSLINGIGKSSSRQTRDIPALIREYFGTHGVDWKLPPGKTVSYDANRGRLFVKATTTDLDLIERTISEWMPPAPQIRIKARFVEVPKGTLATISQLWSVTNRSFSENFTGILYPESFKVAYHALQARTGYESLAEPEATTLSGRQTEMRAIQVVTVATNIVFQQQGDSAITPQTAKFEIGPVLDVIPHVLSDGYKINMRMTASLTEFLGYAEPSKKPNFVQTTHDNVKVMPQFRTSKSSANLTVLDGQTVFIGGMVKINSVLDNVPVIGDLPEIGRLFSNTKQAPTEDEVLVFVTATIVDSAGHDVHGPHVNDKAVPGYFDGGDTNGQVQKMRQKLLLRQ